MSRGKPGSPKSVVLGLGHAWVDKSKHPHIKFDLYWPSGLSDELKAKISNEINLMHIKIDLYEKNSGLDEPTLKRILKKIVSGKDLTPKEETLIPKVEAAIVVATHRRGIDPEICKVALNKYELRKEIRTSDVRDVTARKIYTILKAANVDVQLSSIGTRMAAEPKREKYIPEITTIEEFISDFVYNFEELGDSQTTRIYKVLKNR